LTADLASDADTLNSEHRAIAGDGRILWIHSRGRIERDKTGKATRIMGISIDVTESRMAEEALRRTEKLAAAGRLAATVAHEVNNPLEALTNLVYLAQHTDGLPADAAKFLHTAEGEISRISHIVRQTLGFYRESVHPRPTDLGVVVSEVLDLYRSRANSRSIALSHESAHGVVATVNGGEIKQVIANLMSNAIDATPAGGSIHATVVREGDAVVIQVKDSGTGISKANLARLFEPFFTTKSDVGTGLGLWVSKGIIEKHGGSLTVASETESEHSGTIMSVTLPLVLDDSEVSSDRVLSTVA
jgi:signal transduction histidine kinase